MNEKIYTNNEMVLYINGLLHSIELLNLAPNSGKDYGFVDLNPTSDDLTKSLRCYLETPKWNFNFTKLDKDWKRIIIKDTSWAFIDIIIQNQGYAIGNERYEDLKEKYNIKVLQETILNNIENILKSFESFEVYQIEIDATSADDNSGYFAHGESNYIFNTSEKKMFLLYFRASD